MVGIRALQHKNYDSSQWHWGRRVGRGLYRIAQYTKSWNTEDEEEKLSNQ